MTGTVDGSAEQEKISFGTVAIEFARLRFRKLSGDGIRIYPGSKPQQIRSDQVETAMKFLKLLRPTKKPTIGSGTLKHLAEDWGNTITLAPSRAASRCRLLSKARMFLLVSTDVISQ